MIKVMFAAVLAAFCGCAGQPSAGSGNESAGNAAGSVREQSLAREQQARIASAQVQVRVFSSALDMFRLDMGRYPTNEEGLQALLKQPAGGDKKWRGPYVIIEGGVPNDPWGKPFVYLCPGKHNVNKFDLYCSDPGGKDGVREGVDNWTKP